MCDPAHYSFSSHQQRAVALTLLRQFYDDEQASFRSAEQERLCLHALFGSDNLLAILPTGGGKTLAMMLPSLREPQSLTLIIVPNKSLLEEIRQRALKANIPAKQWLSGHACTRSSGIVLMALETVTSQRFPEFVTSTSRSLLGLYLPSVRWLSAQKGSVDRIFFDEGHQVVTVDHRPKFKKVFRLVAVSSQKIFLTGTCPVRTQAPLLNSFGLPANALVLRAPTHRPNHRYAVLHAAPHVSSQNLLIALRHHLSNSFIPPHGRAIIFSSSCKDATSIAEFMLTAYPDDPCYCSHSEMNADARHTQETLWRSADPLTGRWMSCTTVLAQGTDVQDVVACFIVDDVYGLVNAVQIFGRSGREGQESLNVYVLTRPPHASLSVDPPDYACKAEEHTYRTNTSQCRRSIINEVMDGRPLRCDAISGALYCDVCHPEFPLYRTLRSIAADPDADHSMSDSCNLSSQSPSQSPKASHLSDDGFGEVEIDSSFFDHPALNGSSQSSFALDAEQYGILQNDLRRRAALLDSLANRVRGNCFVCLIHGGVLAPSHPQMFKTCYAPSSCSHGLGWIDFKKRLKANGGMYDSCHQCGNPQGEFQPSCHPVLPFSGPCPLDDMIPVMLWEILHNPSTFAAAAAEYPALHDIPGIPGAVIHNSQDARSNLEPLVQWAVAKQSPHHFTNAVELVIFWWRNHNTPTR